VLSFAIIRCANAFPFAALEKAIAAYHSAAYKEALKAFGDGAARDVRIVEGLEQKRHHKDVW